jgi:hypothetical protein
MRGWRDTHAIMNNWTIISEFDQHNFGGQPPPCTLVIFIFNFVAIEIIGFDSREARQGDFAIGVALFGFYIRASIWLQVSHVD